MKNFSKILLLLTFLVLINFCKKNVIKVDYNYVGYWYPAGIVTGNS